VKEIIRYGHADTKNEAIRITFEHGLHVSLGLTVEGSVKVGLVFFGESNARSKRVLVIVFKDTTGSINSAMDVTLIAEVSKIESSNNVGTNLQ
jgi:hypothetical protein